MQLKIFAVLRSETLFKSHISVGEQLPVISFGRAETNHDEVASPKQQSVGSQSNEASIFPASRGLSQRGKMKRFSLSHCERPLLAGSRIKHSYLCIYGKLVCRELITTDVDYMLVEIEGSSFTARGQSE